MKIDLLTICKSDFYKYILRNNYKNGYQYRDCYPDDCYPVCSPGCGGCYPNVTPSRGCSPTNCIPDDVGCYPSEECTPDCNPRCNPNYNNCRPMTGD